MTLIVGGVREGTLLPRVLYCGDVGVCDTSGGSVLLYRLLQNYPEGRLLIVEPLAPASQTRLEGVPYRTLPLASKRLLHSRVGPYYCCWAEWIVPRRWHRLRALAEDFKAEAVLTVVHGFSWLAAAALAKGLNLPLHVICHDDWPAITYDNVAFKRRVDRDLNSVYRQAARRYCASPQMVETYRERYGVIGTVLYPARAVGSHAFSTPAERLSQSRQSLSVAYAGIPFPPYLSLLSDVARRLSRSGDEVHLYLSPTLKSFERERFGLGEANVRIHAPVASKHLVRHLRESVDVLIVPLAYEPGLRRSVEVAFPSKLSEYTAAGLPIVIWGPEYAAAINWVRDNPDAAVAVTESDAGKVCDVVARLKTDAVFRNSLAAGALRAGANCFSGDACRSAFYNGLRQA